MEINNSDSRAMRILVNLTRKFDHIIHAELKRNNFSFSYYRLLSAVYKNDGANQLMLSHELGLKPPTISSIITNLEKEEYVKRKVDPHDGRATMVFLTEYGRVMEERIEIYEDNVMESFLSGLSSEQKKQLTDLLEIIEKTEINTIHEI